MSTIHVTLTESLNAFVQARLDLGEYSSPEEFVVDLIREAQQRLVSKEVEALLVEGVESEDACEATAEWLAAEKAAIIARHEQRNRP